MAVRKKAFTPQLFWHPESESIIDARDWKELYSLQDNIELLNITGDRNLIESLMVMDRRHFIKAVNLHYQVCDVRMDRPGPYGNPYKIGRDGTRNEVLRKFAQYWATKPILLANLSRWIQVKQETWPVVRLGCWCKPDHCHVDHVINKLVKL